ncbi:MAG: UDP-N-acetylmuramate dehydrogenase [Bacteroidales bacterium]
MHSHRQTVPVHHDFPIKAYNTFGINVKATLFAAPQTIEQLAQLREEVQVPPEDFLVIGEGSNMLFTSDFKGLILKPAFSGIRLLSEEDDRVLVEVGATENWDHWIRYSLQQGWYGLENLSLIPGSVGAAPVQNIGAYGVEMKDRFAWLDAWDLMENKGIRLHPEECHFGYRSSVFKSGQIGRYVITRVTFSLRKSPDLQLGYGHVREAFLSAGGSSPEDLRKVIISIRSQKLPDPSAFGNAGSFFKNPVLPYDTYEGLRQEYPEIPGHSSEHKDFVKVPAAWLIEKSGWKGKRQGNVGSWPGQPLVIVNYGGASGQEILEFSEKIRQDVHHKFNILLEREVNIIGNS